MSKYKIEFDRTDSKGDTIKPYEGKEFLTRIEANNYLKNHPGAKGAKIVKVNARRITI